MKYNIDMLFHGKNIFYLIIYTIIGIVLIAIVINLYRMPTKYILSDEFLTIDGKPEPIPIELYLKNIKKDEVTQIKTDKSRKHKKGFKTEGRCREILEKLFNKKFESIRPDWLINPITGSNLELDCYNKELKLAVEVDGVQHAEFSPHFHKNKTQFNYQVMKDRHKDKVCKDKKIDLIRVPHTVKYEKLEEYLINELKKIGRLS